MYFNHVINQCPVCCLAYSSLRTCFELVSQGWKVCQIHRRDVVQRRSKRCQTVAQLRHVLVVESKVLHERKVLVVVHNVRVDRDVQPDWKQIVGPDCCDACLRSNRMYGAHRVVYHHEKVGWCLYKSYATHQPTNTEVNQKATRCTRATGLAIGQLDTYRLIRQLLQRFNGFGKWYVRMNSEILMAQHRW
jgi:hypothetical protein